MSIDLDALPHPIVGAPMAGASTPALAAIVSEAGFTRFRLATQTAFNNIYEIRP